MDSMTTLLTLLLTLSLATERVTETIKGIPVVSGFLARKDLKGWEDELRKALIHIIAIATGTYFASQLSGQIAHLLSPTKDIPLSWPIWLLFGALASGGSGIWNTALDLAREFSKQKELATQKMTGA